jgi:hypothetical protein
MPNYENFNKTLTNKCKNFNNGGCNGGMGAWRHGGMEAWRHGGMEAGKRGRGEKGKRRAIF